MVLLTIINVDELFSSISLYNSVNIFDIKDAFLSQVIFEGSVESCCIYLCPLSLPAYAHEGDRSRYLPRLTY